MSVDSVKSLTRFSLNSMGFASFHSCVVPRPLRLYHEDCIKNRRVGSHVTRTILRPMTNVMREVKIWGAEVKRQCDSKSAI
jgi:hypothetical protein